LNTGALDTDPERVRRVAGNIQSQIPIRQITHACDGAPKKANSADADVVKFVEFVRFSQVFFPNLISTRHHSSRSVLAVRGEFVTD
jgi:hypothetical protein